MTLDNVNSLPVNVNDKDPGHNDNHKIIHASLKEVKTELDNRLSDATLGGKYAPNETIIVATSTLFPSLDSSGATSAVAALTNILLNAPNGATIRLKGTYLIDSLLAIPPDKFLTIDATAATIILHGSGTKIRCLGSFGGAFAVSAIETEALVIENKTRTFTKITCATAPPYVNGDVVKIIANDVIPAGHVTSQTTAPRVGEFAIVHKVVGNVLYLKNQLLETYTLNPRIARLNPGSMQWIGGEIKASDTSINSKHVTTWIRLQNLTNPKVIRPTMRRLTSMGISMKSNFGYSIEDAIGMYAMDDTDNGNVGYFLHDSGCNGGRVRGGDFTAGRHAYTDGTADSPVDGTDFADYGATLDCKIIGATSRAMTAASWDTHHDSMGVEFIDCTAYPMPDETAYMLRGRKHRIVNPKTYGGKTMLTITTQLTGTYSTGESHSHEIVNPWSDGTKELYNIIVRDDVVHAQYGIKQPENNLVVHGGTHVGADRILYTRNARVLFSGGQRVKLGATAAVRNVIETRNTFFAFDSIVLDASIVENADVTPRRILLANDTVVGGGSEIQGRYLSIVASPTFVTGSAGYIIEALAQTSRFDFDDIVLDTYWNTSTPILVPDSSLIQNNVKWRYRNVHGNPSYQRSSKVLAVTNAQIASTASLRNLARSTDDNLLLTVATPDATTRTLAQLWFGKFIGQRLTILRVDTGPAITIVNGTTGRTALVGGADKNLATTGDIISLIWTGSTWTEV